MAEVDTVDDAAVVAESPVDIIKLQQEFYDMFGHKSNVIYDCYTTSESLEMKISLIMPEMRRDKQTTLAKTIWDQKKFTADKCLLMSPIFVCCMYDNAGMKDRLTYPLDIKSTRFSIHPVFRVQKCTTRTGFDSFKRCALFVDEFARVYANWADFREKNKYDDCLVVTPKNGIYSGSDDDKVLLDIFLRRSGFTKNLDTGSTVVGLASAGVAAAAFIPSIVIAPAVVAGAAVAGISCAVYTGLRSAYDLYDRRNHKQSIAIKNREARASWLNIAAGTFTASAAGATQIISKAAQNGQNISHITRNTIKFMNVGALSLHTTGCLDGVHSMLNDFYNGESISKVQLAQLSASLFLLTHSIRNFQAARTLLKLSDADNPNSMKEILCEKQKWAFEHLVNETVLIRGLEQKVGNVIVRSLKMLCNANELLLMLRENELKRTAAVQVGPFEAESPQYTSEPADRDQVMAEAKEEELGANVSADVRIQYCRVFDQRVASIVNALDKQVKHRDAAALKQIVIYCLRSLSLNAFELFMHFVQELMIRIGKSIEEKLNRPIDFECFVKMVFDQFNSHAKEMNLEEFVVGTLTDSDGDRKQQIDYDIRQHLLEQDAKTVEQIENDFVAGNVAHEDLSENRKVLLTMDERVKEFASRFRLCCPAAVEHDLQETIEEILRNLSYESADIFFFIAVKLIDAHAQNVQSSLGRFIPVEIFITDTYCLLSQISCEKYDSVNEYLFGYTDDLYETIETEFKGMYERPDPSGGRMTLCAVCSGDYFAGN